MNGSNMPAPSARPIALMDMDDSAFVKINVNSSTANTVIVQAGNRALGSTSYTFTTTSNLCIQILSAQCDRFSNYIFGQLEYVSRSNDDHNESIADNIANIIGLMGEPAAYTAAFEANLLKSDLTRLEPLLIAIATAPHKETEQYRIDALERYARDANYRVKRAAVRALGRIGVDAAKDALRNISRQNEGGELGRLAAAFLR